MFLCLGGFFTISTTRTENRTASNPTAYHQVMQLLEALATAFFRTFGITQPSAQALRRAVWFLFGLLALIVFTIGAATIIVFHIM